MSRSYNTLVAEIEDQTPLTYQNFGRNPELSIDRSVSHPNVIPMSFSVYQVNVSHTQFYVYIFLVCIKHEPSSKIFKRAFT
jgi:hypothetical protein